MRREKIIRLETLQPEAAIAVVLDRYIYNPNIGALLYRNSGHGRKRRQKAGRVDIGGYLRVKIGGYGDYPVHRIIWLLENAGWPDGVIDHINGDRKNNRIGNLRSCSQMDNAANQPIPKNNTSGMKGVRKCPSSNRWIARIQRGGKSVSIGAFDTKRDAFVAYRSMCHVLFGEFSPVACGRTVEKDQ